MYEIFGTDSFSGAVKKQKKNKRLLNELEKKIQKLKENPENVGKDLSGGLTGHKSTRLVKKFRLIFKIDKKNKRVYLEALDHRKYVYE